MTRAHAASAWTRRAPAWERSPAVRTWLVALAIALVAVLLPSPRARADETPDTPAQATDLDAPALFARAEAEDARGQYARAIDDYRAAVAELPSFRYAAKAMTRAALLQAHSEGGFAPFAQLEAVRRDPRAASDPRAIDALASSADAFPPGPTRSEARMLCAEAYVSRLGRRSDGEAALRKVVDDPRADGLLRREAANLLITALIDDGDLAGAQATVPALGRTLDTRMAERVTELVRRRRVHVASIVDLVLFVLLAGVAIGRAALRGEVADVARALKAIVPLVGVFATYVAVVGGALASGYETGNATPFLAFGIALVPVTIAARAWSAAGSEERAARIGRAVLSAATVMAAAFLTLEMINGQYLESFSL
jgi:hypothetical protein